MYRYVMTRIWPDDDVLILAWAGVLGVAAWAAAQADRTLARWLSRTRNLAHLQFE